MRKLATDVGLQCPVSEGEPAVCGASAVEYAPLTLPIWLPSRSLQQTWSARRTAPLAIVCITRRRTVSSAIGIDGDGRGDPRSPGKAPDLHATQLDREQLIEVIRCGRPGSQMPHFDKYAYEAKECYGLSAA